MGGDLDPAKIGALKTNSVIGWGRLEGEGDFASGMESDSGAIDHSA
jgi:hypothetical protein